MTTLLVMTAGQSDVQLVIDNVRYELLKQRCGELHDELESRGFTIVEAPETKKMDKRIEALPDAELSVCTPKLDAVLRFFGESLPTHTLVFDTRRVTQSDPRLSGRVLELRLKSRNIEVHRHSFLEDKEWLEDQSNEIDAVVRRAVVEKLNSAICQELDETRFDRVFVARTGGIPDASDVIEELVRLHAVGGPNVTALKVPEGDRAQDDRAVEEKFHPAAGYRARWHALSLVEKGNLLGAWGAVSHLEGAPGQEWTQVIQWLAHFASSLPLPTGCDLAVLSHDRMAVRAALRVELALRARDIPRAVHGTVAFFEAALWDHLNEKTERHPQKRQFKFVSSPSEELVRERDKDKWESLSRNKKDEDEKRPFIFVSDNWYEIDAANSSRAGRISEKYLGKPHLTVFNEALGDETRGLRNDAAHADPTPERMNGARVQMRTKKLWSDHDTFLTQPLVEAVLKELGESEPTTLLECLLAEVRRRLVAPDSAARADP